VSNFYSKESFGFLDDFVAPHGFCLDEPQD